MAYIKPQDVTSPRAHWRLLAVLYDGGPSEDSLAVGFWDNTVVLVSRWNGNDEVPIGMPQSRGLAVWYVLPPWMNEGVIAQLDEEMQAKAKAAFALAPTVEAEEADAA